MNVRPRPGNLLRCGASGSRGHRCCPDRASRPSCAPLQLVQWGEPCAMLATAGSSPGLGEPVLRSGLKWNTATGELADGLCAPIRNAPC